MQQRSERTVGCVRTRCAYISPDISFILPYISTVYPFNLHYVYSILYLPRRVRTCLRSLFAVSALFFVLLAVAGLAHLACAC